MIKIILCCQLAVKEPQWFKILASNQIIIANTYEPSHEKTNILHMQKQSRRSASR